MVGLPTLIATFVAGLGSFLNPCSLPLLPAYLSYAGGISAADLVDPERRHRHRGRLVGGTLLFVAGFGAVFVLLGIGAGGLGRQVREAERPVVGGRDGSPADRIQEGIESDRIIKSGGFRQRDFLVRMGTRLQFPNHAQFLTDDQYAQEIAKRKDYLALTHEENIGCPACALAPPRAARVATK